MKSYIDKLIADLAHAEEKAATLCGPCADDHARLAGYLHALLAAHEQEPYGYAHKYIYETLGSCVLSSDHEAYRDTNGDHIPLYTHPAPSIPAAVPEEKVIGSFNPTKNELAVFDRETKIVDFAHWHCHNDFVVVLRHRSAAMLNGGKS